MSLNAKSFLMERFLFRIPGYCKTRWWIIWDLRMNCWIFFSAQVDWCTDDPHLGEGVKGRQGSPGLGQQPLQDEDNLWSGGAPGAGKSYHNGSPGGIIQLPQLFQGGHSAQSLANHQSKNEYMNILIIYYFLSECLGNFGSHSRWQRGPGPSVCQWAQWPD